MGRLKEDESHFNKVGPFVQNSPGPNTLSLVMFLPGVGEHLLHGGFLSCFQEEKRESECPCTCCFPAPLAQNNPYTKVAYHEVACSVALQGHHIISSVALAKLVLTYGLFVFPP